MRTAKHTHSVANLTGCKFSVLSFECERVSEDEGYFPFRVRVCFEGVQCGVEIAGGKR